MKPIYIILALLRISENLKFNDVQSKHREFNHKFHALCIYILFTISSMGKAEAQEVKHCKVDDKQIDTELLDKQINELIESSGVPGLSLALIDNNEVVYYNTYGIRSFKDRTLVNKETVFNGGSLTKTYLVFTAYKLVDQGILDLEKPMYEYLPYPRLAHDERYKLITPRMILNHSSGLENWQFENDPDTLEILIDPGTGFVYSGEGYDYLALVIEELLEKPYQEYTSSIVNEPLNLKHTLMTVKKEGDIPENYTDNHNAFKEQRPMKLATHAKPAYGNYFTAEEYARLVLATYDEDHFTKESINNFLYVPNTLKPEVSSPEKETYMYQVSGYFMIHSKKDTVVYFVGSGDGNFSVLAYSPSRKCGVVFMTNSGAGYFIVSKMGELTTDFDIDWTFMFDKEWQYPSVSVRLMAKYDKDSPTKLLAEVAAMYKKEKTSLDDFKPLGGFLNETDKAICNDYLLKLIELFPKESWSYEVLAKRYIKKSAYNDALDLLKQAQRNGVQGGEIRNMIEECNEKIAKKF